MVVYRKDPNVVLTAHDANVLNILMFVCAILNATAILQYSSIVFTCLYILISLFKGSTKGLAMLLYFGFFRYYPFYTKYELLYFTVHGMKYEL